MELTIKELAPYLPYGLKCKIEVFGDNETIVGLEGLNHNEVELSGVRKTVTEYFEYNEIKPILYPLDFLTKKITHNGETFVPINELSVYTRQQTENGKSGFEWGIINTFPYKDILQLLEWHFDIFNLIENNLAIPVTEDFNPYK